MFCYLKHLLIGTPRFLYASEPLNYLRLLWIQFYFPALFPSAKSINICRKPGTHLPIMNCPRNSMLFTSVGLGCDYDGYLCGTVSGFIPRGGVCWRLQLRRCSGLSKRYKRGFNYLREIAFCFFFVPKKITPPWMVL